MGTAEIHYFIDELEKNQSIADAIEDCVDDFTIDPNNKGLFGIVTNIHQDTMFIKVSMGIDDSESYAKVSKKTDELCLALETRFSTGSKAVLAKYFAGIVIVGDLETE